MLCLAYSKCTANLCHFYSLYHIFLTNQLILNDGLCPIFGLVVIIDVEWYFSLCGISPDCFTSSLHYYFFFSEKVLFILKSLPGLYGWRCSLSLGFRNKNTQPTGNVWRCKGKIFLTLGKTILISSVIFLLISLIIHYSWLEKCQRSDRNQSHAHSLKQFTLCMS